ncbi:MAG TPA: outer-membrane lipoprotein carrier protein LolA [Bryobacteraceae bacterium]|nr:outer-membrane lipoprotein carrier protein LolA [Bryobacteraceae bacterium]
MGAQTRFSIIFALLLPAGLPGAQLDDVLAKMDQSAGKFTSMAANLTKMTYTKVIDDKSQESGTIVLKKGKGRDLHALLEFKKPDPKMISLNGIKAEYYLPNIKTVQEWNLGKKGQVEQFLLLGFGTTGKDLASNYSVKYAGEETVAGQKAYHLELLPKSSTMRERLKQLELWITEGESGSYPVQQKFVEPSGNFSTITYSNVKLNGNIPDDALKLKLPKGVKRESPQK